MNFLMAMNTPPEVRQRAAAPEDDWPIEFEDWRSV